MPFMQSKMRDESLSLYFPEAAGGSFGITVNHRPGTYYNTDNFYFDQYSGKQLPGKGTYAASFKQATFADKIKTDEL